jgi:hypothetical protein
MLPTFLAGMLTQHVNVYHLDVTVGADLSQTEGYPDTWHPDIFNLAVMFVEDGKTLSESVVGAVIESDAIMYCESADIRENDRVHFGHRVYRVNGSPKEIFNPFGAAGTQNTPALLEVGLKLNRTAPAGPEQL